MDVKSWNKCFLDDFHDGLWFMSKLLTRNDDDDDDGEIVERLKCSSQLT